MYAMVEILGKQYKVEKGSVLKVDKLDVEAGKELEFDSVLLVKSEGKLSLGTPYVKGAKVSALVEGHGKDKKLIVFKFKRRKDYRRKQGHRQQYSLIKI